MDINEVKTNEMEEQFRAEALEKKKRLKILGIAAAAFAVLCVVLMMLASQKDGRLYPVQINEILASNTRYPNEDGYCCDYIELYNHANYAVDLSGFRLGTLDGNSSYQIPYGTTIEANGYLLIYCDSSLGDKGYAPFGISRAGGETYYLITSNGAVAHSVTTIPVDVDQAMVQTGINTWGATDQVTPGYANDGEGRGTQDIFNSGVSPIRITEISTVNTGYAEETDLMCDWVELYNTGDETVDLSGYVLTDNAGNDKYVFPAGTVISARNRLVVLCSDKAADTGAIAPFSLSRLGGETVVLKDDRGRIIEVVETMSMDSGTAMSLTAEGTWAVTPYATPGYDNTMEGYNACLKSIGAAPGTIVIHEFMSAAQAILPDSEGQFHDWVEIYNSGSEAVSLAGWYLSDDLQEPLKWQFPDTQIQPGEYLVLFLSGRDTVSDGEIHTSFSLSAGGESLILSSCLGNVVDSVTFGASEDHCSFVRNAKGEAVQTACPTPGYSNDDAGYEAFCSTIVPKGPLAIWEVMTYNEKYLAQQDGNCYDWVELRNVSSENVKLSDYCITDDTGTPGQFALPDKTLKPGDSIVIILSGDTSLSSNQYPHAGFSLNAAEDTLYLYSAAGELVDYTVLRDIPVGYSYGREEGRGGFFYMKPTPKRENTEGYRQISSEPESKITAGVYTSDTGFLVPLSSPGTIYYTLDGSDPDTDSKVYSGPIQIDSTTVLRAASLEEGKLISDIYTATFVIQEPHSLPVVSLVTDPDNLWGPNGIYKYNIEIKEEVRPANISYSGPDGTFSMDCRINLHGATSVTAFAKKTFAVRFLDAYDGILNYDVFEDGEVTHFSSLIVRTANEDSISTQMRDALMGHIASQSSDSLISQKHKYVALYLNGEYWGLYALRERHSPEHYAAYTGLPADSTYTVRYCTYDQHSLKDLYMFLGDNNLKSKENYEYAKSVLDMESYADWIIFESYTCNLDVYGNIRYYYNAEEDLWRMGLADLDLGFFLITGFDEIADTFHHGRLVSAVLKNEEFQDMIAKRLAELLEGPLSDENMLATLDSMTETIRDEIILDGERWGYPLRTWERMVRELRQYIDGRADYLIDNFCYEVGFTREEKETYFGHLLK